MSYALNVIITLPEALSAARIAKVNVGRYATLSQALEARDSTLSEEPEIVVVVVEALAKHFGDDVPLVLRYEVEAI